MTTELASEDALRLAVLMAGEVHAVRIDEGRMELQALTPRGEARVALHANCRAESYLTRVREILGGHALGSPGGYPVHLRRWTRMGQASVRNLEALLKLGEPEAVAAVAPAPALSDERARGAWWARPTVETARVMLEHPAVRAGAMGPVLVDYLVEYLPFEADPVAAMNLVRAVLEMQEAWCTLRDCAEDPGLGAEDRAIHEALCHFGRLDYRGGAILIEGKVEAFSLGEPLNPDTVVIHIEKANPEIPGLYAAINQRFVQHAWADYRWINREQDLGLPGLRQAKESYNPDHLEDKYELTPA
jgi:hypothetical protein